MKITAALALFMSDPRDGFLNGFGPIETLADGVPLKATVIPPGNVEHEKLAHSEFAMLITLPPVPRNAASAPPTLRTELFATRIRGPFKVLSVLALLSEKRSPVT